MDQDKTNPVEGMKERLWNAIPDPADESPMGTIVQVLDLTALLSDHTRLEAENAAMRGALEPFSNAAHRINYYDGERFDVPLYASPDGSGCLTELLDGIEGDRLMVSHLRAARTTLGDQ